MRFGNKKIRVVLDTNVYISAIIIGGVCEKLFEEIQKRDFKIFISPFLIQEIIKVLKKKFKWDDEMIQFVICFLLEKAILIYPQKKVFIIKEKEDDNRILEIALEAKAHFLISGDKKHILPLKKINHTQIISPKNFLKILKN